MALRSSFLESSAANSNLNDSKVNGTAIRLIDQTLNFDNSNVISNNDEFVAAVKERRTVFIFKDSFKPQVSMLDDLLKAEDCEALEYFISTKLIDNQNVLLEELRKKLIQYRSPNIRNTYLHLAVQQKCQVLLERLLTHDALKPHVNVTNIDGKTAFQLAFDTYNETLIDILVGVEGIIIPEEIKTAAQNDLFIAVLEGKRANLAKVEEAIKRAERFNYSMQAIDPHGKTILHYAVERKDEALVEMLLKRNSSADFLERRNAKGDTALVSAMKANFNRIVALFFQHPVKADLDAWKDDADVYHPSIKALNAQIDALRAYAHTKIKERDILITSLQELRNDLSADIDSIRRKSLTGNTFNDTDISRAYAVLVAAHTAEMLKTVMQFNAEDLKDPAVLQQQIETLSFYHSKYKAESYWSLFAKMLTAVIVKVASYIAAVAAVPFVEVAMGVGIPTHLVPHLAGLVSTVAFTATMFAFFYPKKFGSRTEDVAAKVEHFVKSHPTAVTPVQ